MKIDSIFAVKLRQSFNYISVVYGYFYYPCANAYRKDTAVSYPTGHPWQLLLNVETLASFREANGFSYVYNSNFASMPKSREICRNVNNSTVLCTPTVAKHRPSYKAKFISERDLKNTAYHFILSMGLINEFRGFCANQSSNPHHDCLSAIIRNLLSE